jgi:hypothetical protein
MSRDVVTGVLALVLLAGLATPAQANTDHIRSDAVFSVDNVVLSPCGRAGSGERIALRGTIDARIRVTLRDDGLTILTIFLDARSAFGTGLSTGAAYALHPGPSTRSATNAVLPAVVPAVAMLHTSIRPNEIGTPWAISSPGSFTSGGHQSHLQISVDASGVSRLLAMSGTPTRTCDGDRRD